MVVHESHPSLALFGAWLCEVSGDASACAAGKELVGGQQQGTCWADCTHSGLYDSLMSRQLAVPRGVSLYTCMSC